MKPPRIPAIAILATGWAIVLIYAYPGYMTVAAVDMLVDSRSGTFSDWHSPMMSLVWRLVGNFAAGPAPMLILQSGLALFGAFEIARRRLGDRVAAVVAAVLVASPPVLAVLGEISPAAQLVGFGLAAAAGVTSDDRRYRALGLASAIVAAGLPGPGFVVGFMCALAFARHARSVVVAIVFAIAIVAVGRAADALLVDTPTDRSGAELAAYDIAGMLAPRQITDAQLREVWPAAPANAVAHAHVMREHQELAFQVPDAIDDRVQLEHVRRDLALAHPRAYLRARWNELLRSLAWSETKSWVAVTTSFVGDPSENQVIAHDASHSVAQDLLVRAVERLSTTFVFHPFWYLLVALALLALAIKQRDVELAGLVASGIAAELVVGVVAVSADFASSAWLVTTTVYAALLVVARRASTGDLGS